MVGFGTVNNFPCADCRENPAPPYGRIFGAAAYAGAVRDAIKLLKFDGKTRMAGPLADLLIELIQAELDAADYDLVIPVPLHTVRQRARGFNQSALLAERILPCFPQAALNGSLRRIRPTRTLSLTKDPAERRANVRGAFAVVGPELADARVLLVDDVVTTGCTVAECARALNRAGASRVDVLAVALA